MPRRRKETLLEQNLIYKGYKLTSKTYYGNRSEKVDSFVYVRSNGVVDYHVHLDNKRECVKYYCFTDSGLTLFTSGILGSLEEINRNFQQELMEIYDFENKCAKEYIHIESLEDIENPFDEPFIEESNFDD